MTEAPEERQPQTLREIVDNFNGEDKEVLYSALLSREDAMREYLNLAGMQFGLYPFIVTEVLTQVGFGTPPSTEERELIRRNFVEGMEELRRQMGGG